MITATKARLRLCILLLVVLLVFIWGNSLLPAEKSSRLSKWLLSLLTGILPERHPDDAGHHILRKLMHFLEFFCLGICLSWLVRMVRKVPAEHFWLPLAGGALAALIDEAIQLFVPGRGPGLLDAGIDTLGVAMGVVAIFLTYNLQKKEQNKYLEEKT